MLESNIDRIRSGAIEGWAWDSSRPSSSILIALIANDREIISINYADEFRSDLAAAGKGNGAHGFTIYFPEATNIEKMRVVAIEYNYELTGSPLHPSPKIDQCVEQDVFCRFSDETLRVKALSSYLDRLEHELTTRYLLLRRHATELKNRFGVLREATFPRSATKLVDVIFFPPIDWSYRVQRPQRLAASLAALGCRVWYVSPQMLPPIMGMGDASYVIYDEPDPGVFLVKVRCTYPHSEINREPLSATTVLCVEQAFAELIKEQAIERPCYVIGSAGWQPILNVLPSGNVIYDLMDWLAGFSATTPSLLQAECELASSANMVVCSSSALLEYAATEFKHQNILLLRNATHPEMFSLPAPKGQWVVGYMGAIEHWFDRDLIVEVAESMPDVQFILVGHVALMHEALRSVSNISCVGECSADRVAAYVSQLHVGIIPFLDNELIRHTDPVKVYEYLAAGRHVVSTDLPELHRFKEWVTIAKTPEEFADGIRKALTKSGNSIDIAARKRLVMNDTWPARAAMLHVAMLAQLSEFSN